MGENAEAVGDATGTQAARTAAGPEASIGTTPLGDITSCDPVAARFYGYIADELIGRSVNVLVPPERQALESDAVRRVVAGEQVAPFRTERIHADGTALAVSLTVSAVVDVAGAIVGVMTVSRLIGDPPPGAGRTRMLVEQRRTEIREAGESFQVRVQQERARERALAQDAEECFQARADAERAKERAHAQDAEDRFHARMDAERVAGRLQVGDAGEQVQVQDAEDRFQRRMASERGQERARAQHAEDRFQARMDTERSRGRAEVQAAEDRFHVSIDAERAKAHGDQERLEAHLQQSQRLEVLGQLAGGVAHDFNNLLAVILNYAAFVTDELAARHEDNLERIVRDVAQIQRAAERATVLTHQLLAFARREVIQPKVLDLNVIVADVEQLLRRTIGEDVVLQTNLAASPWPVLIDAGQIEQVLVNLAVNARDAMSSGGVLTIDTANVMTDADLITVGSPLQVSRYVRLRVGDTGSGMPAHVVEHAFEPFYTTKPDGKGTGLGLATVYGIVVQAGGAIDIRSQPGVGTTFTIMLPVTDELAEVATEPASYERVPKGETVLIVEDEAALREVTERIFTRVGYHVLTAADGREAIELAAQHEGEIHLLVTDVVMPNMLGKEVVERLRQIKPDIAVLYMSGYAQPVLASQGRLDPGVNLIEKPFTAASLLEKAAQVLNGHFHGFSTVAPGAAAPAEDTPAAGADPPPATRA
jgi:PAS domain S-box-containing protein